MTDYSDIIEREYLIGEIEEYIENAPLERLREIREIINNFPK